MLKQLVTAAYKPFLKRYLGKPRKYSYNGISLIVEPGVFHPGFFFSTNVLLDHMDTMEVQNKTLLELGAGNGLIAIHAAARGARVTATDISGTAVRTIERNALLNTVRLTILQSDMFDAIPVQYYDFILVNPPFYRKKPVRESDYAWYCGEDGEYFQKFFAGLGKYAGPESKVLMVLSDVCDAGMVRAHARVNGFVMQTVVEKKKYWETVCIFEIKKEENAADRVPALDDRDKRVFP